MTKYPDTNMIMQMLLLKFKIVEVPAVMHPRTAGVSMHSGLKPIWYMLRMFFSVLAVIFRCKVLKVDENVGLEDIDAKMDKLKQEELKMEELHHTKRKKAELKSQS